MSYPGGKGSCYQHIINQMPPHQTYIETHLGGGSVMLKKRPAQLNIGIELDPQVLHQTAQLIAPGYTATPGGAAPQPNMAVSAEPAKLASTATFGRTAENGRPPAKYYFRNYDAADFLISYQFTGNELIYLDPPYLMSTRSSKRPIYKHEYTQADHIKLLNIIKTLNCNIIISGYWSQLYADMLPAPAWRTHTFTAATRAGTSATEYLWLNYPEPDALHDYRYLGDDYNQRWNLTKRKRRWLKRLKTMPPLERKMLLWAITEAGFNLGRHSHP